LAYVALGWSERMRRVRRAFALQVPFMIRAAVLPGKWTAIVIANDREFVFRTSFLSGELKDHVWTFFPERVASTILGFCSAHEVESVVIDYSAVRNAKSHEITNAVHEALTSIGIDATIDARWRKESRPPEWLSGWTDSPFEVQRDCGSLLVTWIERGAEIVAGHAEPDKAGAEIAIERVASNIDGAEIVTGHAEPEGNTGGCFAALRPGSTRAVFAVFAPGLVRVAHRIAVGKHVIRKKPLVIVRGGETVTIRTKHVFVPEDADAVARFVLDQCTEHGARTLVLEYSANAFAGTGRGGRIMTAMIRSAFVAATVRSAALAAGIEIVTVSPAKWHAGIAPKKPEDPRPTAERIRDAVRARFPSVEDHEAIGIGMWYTAECAQRTATETKKSERALRARSIAAVPRYRPRKPHPCGCPKGRHRADCVTRKVAL
jgi:hypothetical protein